MTDYMEDTDPAEYAVDLLEEVDEDIVVVLAEAYFLLTTKQRIELKQNIS